MNITMDFIYSNKAVQICIGSVFLAALLVCVLCTCNMCHWVSYDVKTEETKIDIPPPFSTDEIKVSQDKEAKPKGLQNLGNTCFMNAILQNLAWCPKLQIELEKAKWTDLYNMSRSVLDLLKYTHSEGINHGISGYTPFDILSAARRRNSLFDGYGQQDTMEMFNTIITAIKQEMLPISETSNSNEHDSKKTYNEHIMRECTGVRLFFGTFVTEYDYSSCEHVECVFESFSSISVPIVIQDRQNYNNQRKDQQNKSNEEHLPFKTLTGIERGMTHGLMKIEILEEESLPCRKCVQPKKHGQCKQTMLIFEPPFILVLHINRFREVSDRKVDKNNDKVTYPETLNIDNICSRAMEATNADQNRSYSIFGVVAHSGTVSSGHYVAYIKTTQRSTALWYENMNNSWKDPKNRKNEVENKLEKLKENQFQTNCRSEHLVSTFKQEEKGSDECKWYYISDACVRACKKEEAIDNKNAYVLLYEKI